MLDCLVPSQVFEIVLNIASLGIVSIWGFIVVCQRALRRAVVRGKIEPRGFRMPLAPATSWLTLASLLGVLVLIGLDYPNRPFTIAAMPLVAIVLGLGWMLQKGSSPLAPPERSREPVRITERQASGDPR